MGKVFFLGIEESPFKEIIGDDYPGINMVDI